MVITLPATCVSSMPLPGSSAAATIACSRYCGVLRSAGSSARRWRATRMKPSMALCTAASARSSSRSDGSLKKRQHGSAVIMRVNSFGKILSRWRWMRSSSDCSVLTSVPKASPDGIDGETHQVGLQIDGPRGGGGLPALAQAFAAFRQRRVVGLDVPRVEGGHHHVPLAFPGVAVDAEQARLQAHLQAYGFEPVSAAEALGPVAQHRRHGLVVGHDQQRPAGRAGQVLQLAQCGRGFGDRGARQRVFG